MTDSSAITVASPWEVPADRLANVATFIEECKDAPDALIYFQVNVGDGDTQLLLLPQLQEAGRHALVVDAATSRKLPMLVDALAGHDLLAPQGGPRFPLVVATHPHADHIGGLPRFLARYGNEVVEFWEPGYFHPSASYVEMMVQLEEHRNILHSQPTSGLTKYLDRTKLTVIAPGIGLRGRFDSYGVAINNASLALRIDFPHTRVTQEAEPASGEKIHNRTYIPMNDPWRLLMGADAQATAWAQATVDFPELVPGDRDPTLQRELRRRLGVDPLRAQIFKVPHHASKHGLNLELVERIAPRLSLISSRQGGRYGFPHRIALDAIREGREPTTTSGAAHSPDHKLGIHYTCATSAGQSLGSIALLIPPRRGRPLRMWRFFDRPDEPLDLELGRAMRLGKEA